MGQEEVYFKNKMFYYDNQVISWVQKFMELYLSSFSHPKWFENVIEELHGDFYIPYRKEFFDEEIVGNDKDRLDYCIKMLDLTIAKIDTITKKEFFKTIRESIRGSWCDISSEFYNEEWFNDDENYKKKYIGSLLKLKEIMKD